MMTENPAGSEPGVLSSTISNLFPALNGDSFNIDDLCQALQALKDLQSLVSQGSQAGQQPQVSLDSSKSDLKILDLGKMFCC
jgi:hypothetical protein